MIIRLSIAIITVFCVDRLLLVYAQGRVQLESVPAPESFRSFFD